MQKVINLSGKLHSEVILYQVEKAIEGFSS